jgi:hypothetical protein
MIADVIIAEIRRTEAARVRVTRCPPMPAAGVMSWSGLHTKTGDGGKVPVTNTEDPIDTERST